MQGHITRVGFKKVYVEMVRDIVEEEMLHENN